MAFRRVEWTKKQREAILSDRPLAKVARELDCDAQTIKRWRAKLRKEAGA